MRTITIFIYCRLYVTHLSVLYSFMIQLNKLQGPVRQNYTIRYKS